MRICLPHSTKAITAGIALASASLLTGCTMTGADNLSVSEVLMYGKAQDRLAWVYGQLNSPSSNLRLGEGNVELRPQLDDTWATAGSLSVNGRAVYRSKTSGMLPAFSGTRLADGTFDIQNQNAMLSALFYTDGRTWQKLSGTMGRVAANNINEWSSVGQLSSQEARILGNALLGQGEMLVGVVSIGQTEPKLTIEPEPKEYRRTALYLAPVAQAPAPTTVIVSTGPTPPSNGTTGSVTETPSTGSPSTGSQSTPITPTAGSNMNDLNMREIGKGNNASVDGPTVMTASDAAGLRQIYAAAYGNQSSAPALPSLGQQQTLVAVFLGQRSSGGYSVRPVRASASGSSLTLTVEVTEPAPDALVSMALTSPWTLVSVDGSYSSVNVIDQQGRPLSR